MRRHVLLSLATLIVATSVAMLPTPVNAQVTFGAVVGLVVDTGGAALSGATVNLTNLATNELRTAQTGVDGRYTFPNLAAGLYRIEADVADFKRFVQNEVQVQVDVTTRVDITLEVGDVSESVQVINEAPPLQTESASLGTVINLRMVEGIPLSGRNVNNMLTLVPGVVAQGGTYGNAVSNMGGGARTNAVGFGNYAIGGGFGNQSSFYVDGAPSNVPAGNLNAFIPSQDVVQQFRIVTNNVAAEYGNYAGGVVNLTTKSGANNFHGSAYEYFRDRALNANGFFAKRAGLAKPPLEQNQFGGTLGGPIQQDRTFFFGGIERQVLHTGSLVTNTVPTAAQLAGDFSADGLPAIYDHSLPGNPQFQCQGRLNVICPDRIHPSARALLAASYPSPNQPGLVNNFIVQMATGGVNNQYNGRVDHRVSDYNNLFARYTYWKAQSFAYDAWGTQTQGQGPTGLITHGVVVGDSHVLSPSMVLDVRLSALKAYQHEFPVSSRVDLSRFGPGWAGLETQLPAPANLPALSFADAPGVTPLTGSDGVGSQLYWRENLFTVSGNITKLAGRHQLKFGGLLRFTRWNTDPANGVLTLNHNQFATAQSSSVGGHSLASALLGLPSTTTAGYIGGSKAHYTSYGFFLDDTFHATRTLTITAGLRWDQPGIFAEDNNNDTVFLPDQPSPLGSFGNPVTGLTQQLMGNVALVGTEAWPSEREDHLHWNLFSPRLGLAYRADDRTVLRAGYGISYPPPALSQDGPNLSPINAAPTVVANTFQVQTGAPDAILATAGNPFPFGIDQPQRRHAAPGFFYGQSFAMRVPGDSPAYVQQWNVAVERQIGWNSSLSVAYAGSKGTNLLLQGFATVSNIGLNQLPEQYFSMGADALLARVPNPFFGVITTPGSPLSQPTVSAGQLLRPFPQYDRILALDPHRGKSSYQSLQARLIKRFGDSGIVNVAYTFSRLMSNTDSVTSFLDEGFIFGGQVQDNDSLDDEYSLSSYDIPHNLAIGYGIDLPFGRGKRFLGDARGILDGLVSGWRVGGITTFRSGVPFQPTQIFAGSALSQLGGGGGYWGLGGLTMRPDVVPGCDKARSGSREERATGGWFNTACFTPVPSTDVRFGNSPRVDPDIRMDALHNWDFSIAKRAMLTNTVYLQVGAEFFNMFNRTRFGAPDNFAGSAAFGIVTSQASPPREIQFSLRLGF